MGIRDISDKILAELQQGRSRAEIFEQLARSTPQDSGKIAYCIASTPEENLRVKFLTLNAGLCLLLLAYSILTVFSALPIEPDQPTLFIVINSVVPLIFLYFVFRFHGGAYRIAGIWTLIDLLETILLTGAPNSAAVIRTLVMFFIVVLSFLIARKVFPNLGVLGPKKDSSGKYLL